MPSQNFHHDGGRELEVGVPGSLPERHLVGEAGDEVGNVGRVGMDGCKKVGFESESLPRGN